MPMTATSRAAKSKSGYRKLIVASSVIWQQWIPLTGNLPILPKPEQPDSRKDGYDQGQDGTSEGNSSLTGSGADWANFVNRSWCSRHGNQHQSRIGGVNQHLIRANNQRVFSCNLFNNLLMIQANQEFLQRADLSKSGKSCTLFDTRQHKFNANQFSSRVKRIGKPTENSA